MSFVRGEHVELIYQQGKVDSESLDLILWFAMYWWVSAVVLQSSTYEKHTVRHKEIVALDYFVRSGGA